MRCILVPIAVLLAAWSSLAAPSFGFDPDPPARDGAPTSTTASERDMLARQVTDGRFAVRVRASRRLESLGIEAFSSVEAIVREGDREARSRGFAILRAWSRSPRADLTDATLALLRDLTVSSDAALARHANEVLRWRRLAVHEDAVEFLEGLGARVTVRGAGESGRTTVHVAQTWRGNDEDLDRLRDVGGLNWLSIEDSRTGNRGLEAIAACNDLQFVMLGRSAVTERGLGALRRLERLQHVSLQELPVNGAALVELGAMPHLVSLGLDHTRMTDDDLVHLTGFPNLKNLWLDRTAVTDSGLERLTHLSNLTHLYLLGTRTGGPGIRHLAKLSRLTHLSLKEVRLTPEAVRQLGTLSTLVSLGLDDSNVTDDMLAELGGLNNLQVLWLSKSSVTDGAFAHLERMSSLRTVYGHGTRFTKEGAESFKRRTSDRCRVHF
ncbi:MAG: hypothetical protein FJ297_00040 [Planctomycetes bacterium]|nr:hypothetical protein [Planctomycetota bacterium]